MRRTLPDLLPWLLLVAASTAAFYVVQARPDIDLKLQWVSPIGHIEVVSIVSALCATLPASSASSCFAPPIRGCSGWRWPS